MSKIEKIRAEIERLKGQLIRGACAAQIEIETNCKDEAYNEVLAFLDTLSEEPDKSLVEEVKRYYSDNFAYISSDQPTLSILTNVARHFAEWQKQQMLKEAVEGKVYFQMGGIKRVKSDDFENPDIYFGDKVKLIIVKED